MSAFSPAFKRSIEERIKNGSLRVSGQPPVTVNAVVSKLPAINRPSSGGMDSLTRLRALGRMKDGKMNKTEAAYEAHLKHLQMSGEILWYAFDSIKLRLANNTFLSVDFFILTKDFMLQAIDVKGSMAIITDDAAVKMKLAAEKFPWQFFYAIPMPKKDGGGFRIVEI
jgi:hypothetical protein